MPLSMITNLHIDMCVHHAFTVDPNRGERWEDAFNEMAKKLGYAV
jgi:hypothetical protein